MGRVGWRRLGWPRVGWLLVAGYLAQVALRLAISVGRDGPTNIEQPIASKHADVHVRVTR